jgi:hypothetical protein
MATVLAPMFTGSPDYAAQPPVPAQRYAVTNIVNTAWVVEDMTKSYIAQYGEVNARLFIERIEVVRGNTAPKGEVFHHVARHYGR